MEQEMRVGLTRAQAKPILDRTFPDYKGRKIVLSFRERVWIHNTNWVGGTKNEYAAIHQSGATGFFDAPAPWDNLVEGKVFDIPRDCMLVELAHYANKQSVTIYVHISILQQLYFLGNMRGVPQMVGDDMRELLTDGVA